MRPHRHPEAVADGQGVLRHLDIHVLPGCDGVVDGKEMSLARISWVNPYSLSWAALKSCVPMKLVTILFLEQRETLQSPVRWPKLSARQMKRQKRPLLPLASGKKEAKVEAGITSIPEVEAISRVTNNFRILKMTRYKQITSYGCKRAINS
jgi:hypothetical protein